MSNLTTTEKNWLTQFTTITRRVYEDMLKLRKKDYTDVPPPPDVVEWRRINAKLQEHDNMLENIKRGIMNIAGGFGKKK